MIIDTTLNNKYDKIVIAALEIKEEDGEEVYDTVMDDEEAERVFAKFQEEYGNDDEEDAE